MLKLQLFDFREENLIIPSSPFVRNITILPVFLGEPAIIDVIVPVIISGIIPSPLTITQFIFSAVLHRSFDNTFM